VITLGRRVLWLSLLSLPTCLLLGCSEGSAPTGPPKPLEYEILINSPSSFSPDSGLMVARSHAEFEEIWERAYSWTRPVPEIDFTDSMLIAYFMGGRGHSGYRIENPRLERRGIALCLSLTEVSPAPDCAFVAVWLSPFVLIKTPRSLRPVSVDVSTLVRPCKETAG
jgi:hypothetical protein